jgi:hypothetical protein
MMGFMGKVDIPVLGAALRATSCSLNAKQTIDHPDVIDGTSDWSIYQLRGIEIDGDVAFPVLNGQGFIANLFTLVKRGGDGQPQAPQFDTNVFYGAAGAYGRKFQGCVVNSFEIRATAGERVDCTINIWGRKMEETGSTSAPPGSVLRVLGWADINVSGVGGNEGCDIRELSVTVNNSLARNYTFCAADGYFPNNISAGKRQVNGTLGFLGPAPTPGPTNIGTGQADCAPTLADLSFNFLCGVGSISAHGVVFEYQTLEAQPGVITSTVNWYAHSGDINGSIEGA